MDLYFSTVFRQFLSTRCMLGIIGGVYCAEICALHSDRGISRHWGPMSSKGLITGKFCPLDLSVSALVVRPLELWPQFCPRLLTLTFIHLDLSSPTWMTLFLTLSLLPILVSSKVRSWQPAHVLQANKSHPVRGFAFANLFWHWHFTVTLPCTSRSS